MNITYRNNNTIIKNPSFSNFHINIIPGQYYFSHDSFRIGSHKLTIKKRKLEIMAGKPKYYLGAFSNNKFYYISSLYPTGSGTFIIEYHKKYFNVILLGNSQIKILSASKDSKVKVDDWQETLLFKQLELFSTKLDTGFVSSSKAKSLKSCEMNQENRQV